jgi:U5 small nuclear ribonucleoprotein component
MSKYTRNEWRRCVRAPVEDQSRSFVEFVLEPLYKLCAHTLGEERQSLEVTLGDVGLKLAAKDYKVRPIRL